MVDLKLETTDTTKGNLQPIGTPLLGEMPDCASHALFSMSECQAQARREHEFVLFFPNRRIGDVGVAKIVLPS